ncbi:adenylyltransferase/cytidyltransferase family protein [Pseudoalteromonas fenneropenaei]
MQPQPLITRCLALGVFDLFHIGHLNYLAFAKAQGDELLVAVAPDAVCLAKKQALPIINQVERLAIVRALAIVKEAYLLPCPIKETAAACAWIKAWGINKIVVGEQWQGAEQWQRLAEALQDDDITVMFAPKTPSISSTDIKAKIRREPYQC